MPRTLMRTVLLVFVLSGCATDQGTSALECGGGGAAAAALLCALAGGNGKNCAVAAVGVGAVGAGVCYSYADHIQKRRQALAAEGDSLSAHLKYLQGINQETEKLNTQLSAQVSAVTTNTDQTVAALARGQVAQADLAQQRSALDKQVNAAQAQVNTASQELDSARQFRAKQTTQSPGLDAEIARLQDLLNQAQRSTTALAAQRQRI